MFNAAARGGSGWGLSPLPRSGLRAVTALAVTGAITAPLVGIATAQTGSLGSSEPGGSTPPASSTTPPPAAVRATVELRVLVLDDGDFSGEAFATRLAAEGVEVDRVNVKDPGRRPITRGMLADDATKTARYMGIVSVAADRTGLTPAENAVIDQFTADYGIREVSANVTPVAEVGLVPTTSGTNFDATSATLTAGALSGERSYLDGPVPFEDLNSGVDESWGYAATPAPNARFAPLLTGPSGGGAGVMMGVHTQGTRERLVMAVAMNQYQHHFKALSHGIITWLTRGVSTSLYRNVFNVQVDDVFLADDGWNPAGNCTFGVNCNGEPEGGALTESRMVAADVGVATSWENMNGIQLDMTFNAFGAGDREAPCVRAVSQQLRVRDCVRPGQTTPRPRPGVELSGSTARNPRSAQSANHPSTVAASRDRMASDEISNSGSSNSVSFTASPPGSRNTRSAC